MPGPLVALYRMPLSQAALWVLLANVVSFALTLALGHLLVKLYCRKPITPAPPPITRREIALAAGCVAANTLITFVGVALWRVGIIHVGAQLGWRTPLDTIVLLLLMDFAMYWLHRIVHQRWLFPLMHVTHHRYDHPRPLTLFVMNPLETLGFGVLWLVVMWLYSASWLGIALYLALNLGFGMMGHLGVEPLPAGWVKSPVLRLISTSTFHAEHHEDGAYNLGFYTLIWDYLFGTLAPDYRKDFAAVQTGQSIQSAQPQTAQRTVPASTR
ncbi:MAG: sterol desaturase family protein [Ktedonobacterales bacterium]